MKRSFSLFPDPDGARDSLKREGYEGVMQFESVQAALRYAHSCGGNQRTKMVLFDIYGKPIIEIPIHRAEFERVHECDSLAELQRLIGVNIDKRGTYRVPHDWVERCWKLDTLHDSKWRREAIGVFAEENGWMADIRTERRSFVVEFKAAEPKSESEDSQTTAEA